MTNREAASYKLQAATRYVLSGFDRLCPRLTVNRGESLAEHGVLPRVVACSLQLVFGGGYAV